MSRKVEDIKAEAVGDERRRIYNRLHELLSLEDEFDEESKWAFWAYERAIDVVLDMESK